MSKSKELLNEANKRLESVRACVVSLGYEKAYDLLLQSRTELLKEILKILVDEGVLSGDGKVYKKLSKLEAKG